MPPAVTIGISAGKFEDLSATGTSSIKNFFAVGNSPSPSQSQSTSQFSGQKRGKKRKSGPLEGLFLNIEKTNKSKLLKLQVSPADDSTSEMMKGRHTEDGIDKPNDRVKYEIESQFEASSKKVEEKPSFFASIMQKRRADERPKAANSFPSETDDTDMEDFAVDTKYDPKNCKSYNENIAASTENSNKSVKFQASAVSVLPENEYENKISGSSSHANAVGVNSGHCKTNSVQADVNLSFQNIDLDQKGSGYTSVNNKSSNVSTHCNGDFVESGSLSKPCSNSEYLSEISKEVVHHPMDNSTSAKCSATNSARFAAEAIEHTSLGNTASNSGNFAGLCKEDEQFCSEDYMKCPKCEQTLPVWEMPEHSDFHFALELQAQQSQNAPAPCRNKSVTETPSSSTVIKDGKGRKKLGRMKKGMADKKTQSVLNFLVKNS